MNHSSIKFALIILVFTLSGLLTYSNTFNSPFYFDDLKRIHDNPNVRLRELNFKNISDAAFNKLSSRNRPVANLSFAFNYYFHQYRLTGYHILNLVIHILTGIFLYLFLKITLSLSRKGINSDGCGRPDVTSGEPELEKRQCIDLSLISFFATLIWFINPVQTQSVTYIVQRMTSMSAMFYVLAFLFYVKGRLYQKGISGKDFSRKNTEKKTHKSNCFYLIWFTGAVISWVLALGSKETAATLPFFIFLYEWYYFQDLNRDWIRNGLKYLAAAIFLFTVIALIFLGNPVEKMLSRDLTFTERSFTEFRVAAYYLSLIFFPVPSRLNLDYDFSISHSLFDPLTTFTSICFILFLVVSAFSTMKKNRLLSFSILWFLGHLIIEAIIPNAVIFEHRTYLPSMLIFIPIVSWLYERFEFKKYISIFLCIAALILSMWTYQRNNIWNNSITFWSDCVKKSPEKARPHFNLGNALAKGEKTEEAIGHYRKALEINSNYAEAHFGLGRVLGALGEVNAAIKHYRNALSIRPGYAEVHNNLAIHLAALGALTEAIDHYYRAIHLKPWEPEIYNNLGVAWAQKGNLEKAADSFSKALEIKPDYENARNNLTVILPAIK